MPLFSLIVPIYNVEPYIRRCVDSLIGQTFSDIEIILVDDESPDDSPRICDEYAKADERIRVIHKKNGGLSDARNAGLEIAAGKYVIFVDADDYIEKNTCEMFAKYAESDIDVLIGDAIVEGGVCDLRHMPQSDTTVYGGEEYLKLAMSQGLAPMAAWLNVLRRDFLADNRLSFKKGILHEDEEFTPKMLMKASSVMLTGICFYRYIIRDNSIMTKSDKRKNAKDFLATAYGYEEIFKGHPDKQLKILMLDSMVNKYLSIYQSGDLKRYGKEFLPRKFLFRNAHKMTTRLKAYLVCISPKLYSFVHSKVKG